MTVYIFHSAQPATGPQCADTVGYLFNKKGAHKLNNQFEKDRGQHPGIVALSVDLVKKGKRQTSGLANPPIFPVFAESAVRGTLRGTMPKQNEQPASISLRQLYPHFTEAEIEIAESNLRRYIAVMVRIYERVRSEQGPEAAKRLAYGKDLTVSPSSSTIPDERSNASKNN